MAYTKWASLGVAPLRWRLFYEAKIPREKQKK